MLLIDFAFFCFVHILLFRKNLGGKKMFDILEYYKMLKENNVNIIYSGPIWSEGLDGIAEMLKKRLALDGLPLTASQSVFSVFVEQMNNMLMYSAEKKDFSGSPDTGNENSLKVSTGVFILGSEEKTYFLQSGNVMKTSGVNLIKKRIDYLNTLDKKELRQYYKEQLKSENTNEESKGAGLGLIEIAKRASSKIKYDFIPLNDGCTFFAMYVKIGG